MYNTGNKLCPECGGKYVAVTTVLPRGQYGAPNVLKLKQPKRSASLFSGKRNVSLIHALTCTVCGYTALYATEPGNLIPDN